MDYGAIGAAIRDRDASDRRSRPQRLAPTPNKLEVQLSQRIAARCHTERKGTDRDTVRAWADGVKKRTQGAGWADRWRERHEARPDLAKRGVARENRLHPLQDDRRSSFVRHDDCDREGRSPDEVDDRWDSGLHERVTVPLVSPDKRRFDQCGLDGPRGHVRGTGREDRSCRPSAAEHDRRSGEKDSVPSCLSPRSGDQRPEPQVQRPRLSGSSAIHLALYTPHPTRLPRHAWSGDIREHWPTHTSSRLKRLALGHASLHLGQAVLTDH